MKKIRICILVVVFIVGTVMSTFGQGRITFTGTVLSYGTGLSTRMRTSPFTLRINGITSEDEARRFLSELQEGGQDDLLEAIRNEDLGTFSLGSQLGRRMNVLLIKDDDGRKKLIGVFERWLGFAELRGGYRSLNYPFSYIELFIDPRTGRGEGTYFAAASIRYRNGNVEVEDFATLPSRLLNVKLTGGTLP